MFFRRKRSEVVSLHINAEKCIGCGECVDSCRRNVLDMEYEADRDLAKIVNLVSCVGCGKCWVRCPMDAIELVVNENKILVQDLR